MNRFLAINLILAVAALAGCGGPPPPPVVVDTPAEETAVSLAEERVDRARSRVARLETELRIALNDQAIADNDAREYTRQVQPVRPFLPEADGTIGTELSVVASGAYGMDLVRDIEMPELRLSYTPEERQAMAQKSVTERALAAGRAEELRGKVQRAREALATAEAELAAARRAATGP